MKHLYTSIPSLKHRVFKYSGAVEDKHLEESVEAHQKFGEHGLPCTGQRCEKGPFKVILLDEPIADRIWEDGSPYGETR
jgi:hypothetical protein